jgi:hypothetical protein
MLSVAAVVIFCAYFCFFLQDTRALAGRIVQHLLKTLDRILHSSTAEFITFVCSKEGLDMVVSARQTN